MHFRTESIEEMLTLRTKAMREKTGLKEMKKRYRYALMRIRFPDGIFLQVRFQVFYMTCFCRRYLFQRFWNVISACIMHSIFYKKYLLYVNWNLDMTVNEFLIHFCFVVQGTFSVYEKYAAVLEFVKENLNCECDFTLLTELGRSFAPADHEKTLLDLRLVPATVLIFKPNTSSTDDQTLSYLKPDILLLLQDL